MSRRTRVRLDDKDFMLQYTNWVSAVIDMIAPKDLFFIGGRATAKTTTIIARRSQQVCMDMPGSMQVLVSDTYMNAMRNIVPSLIEGWERHGWKRGYHFVTDERPPSFFKLPYKPIETYKHTISIYNGCFFNLGSLDQPSGLAGGSYQHMYGDEARVLKFEKLKRLTPAIRGEYVRFGHSVFYRGKTFTTDIPNVLDGDDDWIMENEKHYDKEQAKLALEVAMVLNEIKQEMVACKQIGDFNRIKNLEMQLLRWTERWVKARKGLTFFYMVSTFVNADVLTEGYFEDALKALGFEEFKSAILSLRIKLKKGAKFYINLGQHHFYGDGILSGYFDNVKLLDANDIEATSLSLKYIDHHAKIEAGLDFGDQMSLVTAQQRGEYLYCLKEFYTLPPENSKELALQFREFYKHHKRKELDLYYDRSGNQYSKIKRDWATEFADFIMFENGVPTGWKVNLMNRDQATILHEEEYKVANNIFGEYNEDLPKIRIDEFQCKCLKSSLELTKTIVKTDKTGSKTIHKDKSSEKLPLYLRPMYSTNFSDALKYLICRPSFAKVAMKRSIGGFTSPSTH